MFSDLAMAREHSARRWTALASFTLQAAIVSAAFIYPLLHPQSLPHILRPVFTPVSSEDMPNQVARRQAHSGISAIPHPLVVNRPRFSFTRPPTQMEDAGSDPPDISTVMNSDLVAAVPNSIPGTYAPPVSHASHSKATAAHFRCHGRQFDSQSAAGISRDREAAPH